MKSRRSPGVSGSARKRSRSTPFGITTLGTPTISASFSDITTTRGNRRRARVSKRRQRKASHAARESALAARDLREQVEGDVVLHQDVAAVFGKLRVLHLQRLEAEGAALLARWPAAWRASGTRGPRAAAACSSAARDSAASPPAPRARRTPARAPVPPSPSVKANSSTSNSLRHLAQQIVDAHRAAVRQRERESTARARPRGGGPAAQARPSTTR